MGTDRAKRTMIIGAGDAGKVLLSEIFKAKESPYESDKIAAQYDPICIIDNEPTLTPYEQSKRAINRRFCYGTKRAILQFLENSSFSAF